MTSSLLSASLLPLQVDQNIQMFLFPLSLAGTWNTCKPLHDDFPFQTYNCLSDGEFQLIRQTLLIFFQDMHIRVRAQYN